MRSVHVSSANVLIIIILPENVLAGIPAHTCRAYTKTIGAKTCMETRYPFTVILLFAGCIKQQPRNQDG